jgi:hypothetical protein
MFRALSSWTRAWKVPILLGAVGTLLVAFVVPATWRSSTWDDLTEENYSLAWDQWNRNAPSDYDIEVKVRGRQPAVYRVEVRGGLARQAFRNGAPLKSVRTFETWSAPGMFETVGTDLEHLVLVARGQAGPRTPRLTVLVEFDETYGFPRRYLRVERAGSSGNPEVHWEVLEFTPLDGG